MNEWIVKDEWICWSQCSILGWNPVMDTSTVNFAYLEPLGTGKMFCALRDIRLNLHTLRTYSHLVNPFLGLRSGMRQFEMYAAELRGVYCTWNITNITKNREAEVQSSICLIKKGKFRHGKPSIFSMWKTVIDLCHLSHSITKWDDWQSVTAMTAPYISRYIA